MIDWHIWAISTNRYKRVIEFLDEVDFIEDFLYPVAEKEYNTKAGRKKRNVPIYSNYIFIRYDHSKPENVIVLQDHPWIVQYVGRCTEKEIEYVKDLDNSSYTDVMPTEEIPTGTRVKMVRTPFAGWDAVVVEHNNDKLLVSISIFGGERIIQCKVEDINILE